MEDEGRKIVAVLAPLPRRLAAALYELLLLGGIVGVGFMLPWILIGTMWGRIASGGWLFLHLFMLLGAYFVGCWWRLGATLAMQTWRLRLVECNGAPPGLRRCLWRYLLCWPSWLTGLGVLWAFVDAEGQFLHDRLAGTRVVLLPPKR